jgi:uncharacterized protein DUF2742
MPSIESQQVSWWSVYKHVQPVLKMAGEWPMAGTPAWCALDNDDPAKVAALYDAARHWALRVETFQEARCEASRAISAAADWRDLSRQFLRHESFREAHQWAKRVVE